MVIQRCKCAVSAAVRRPAHARPTFLRGRNFIRGLLRTETPTRSPVRRERRYVASPWYGKPNTELLSSVVCHYLRWNATCDTTPRRNTILAREITVNDQCRDAVYEMLIGRRRRRKRRKGGLQRLILEPLIFNIQSVSKVVATIFGFLLRESHEVPSCEFGKQRESSALNWYEL